MGINDFESRLEADKHLADALERYPQHVNNYQLIEYTQEFNVASSVDKYNEVLQEKRKAALDKLTEEDKIVLGIA